ncbi:preprotein translocase subunit SecE [Burkholderiaceae bacterium FT117]|uniref:preprotein translocase subunit SecE n=1 Tax=Zeimonas sediminis TaxID=2944268 RepID=UPI0023431D75|nr:preprotein translocase subunit SecE [Zeimonas sediminis]MCM5570929.1 preprotein translocase subunit SecE [Zeimonas sediminis]
MSNQAVETVTSGADRAKVVLAIAAVVAGVVGFYLLAQQPTIVRLGAVIAGLLVGGAIAWFSGPGQRFFAFAKDSWSETRRVVWPTRKETTQVTLTVFAFVVVMAIFLWLVDKGLEWVLYDLILGWKD